MASRISSPESRRAAESLTNLLCIAIFDAALILATVLLLVFWVGTDNDEATLSWLHFPHVVLVFFAVVSVCLPFLYITAFFGIVALGALIVDIFILVARIERISTTATEERWVLAITDFFFAAFSLFYLFAVIFTTTRYNFLGDPLSDNPLLNETDPAAFSPPSNVAKRVPVFFDAPAKPPVSFDM